MGGVYNTVNLHVYHYAGNNPVKYVDPDGKFHFAKRNLDGAPWLGIFSNNPLDDRTTKKTTKLTIGDLIMFDLSGQSPNYQGHTVIMTGVVDVTNKIISTVQGHIVGVPTKENYKIGTPMYGADPQYRRFRFDKLFR